MHKNITLRFDDAVTITTQNQKQVFSNAHFKPQSQFCGGLNDKTLKYHNYIQQLQTSTSRSKIKYLFEKMGIIDKDDIDTDIHTTDTTDIIDATNTTDATNNDRNTTNPLRGRINQQLLDIISNGGAYDTQLDSQLINEYLNLRYKNIHTNKTMNSNNPRKISIHGGFSSKTKHHTNSNKGTNLRTMFHNDTHKLLQLQNIYSTDYNLFQIPKLTFNQYEIANV